MAAFSVTITALHTSKRMHFIEESVVSSVTTLYRLLAYVKTYALH